ncbi:MAG: DinB family protein [Acidobacteriia bacterium]|nr:DinB family protein [Terriglobia bacterium]
MAPEIRSEIVQVLENSRQELTSAASSLSDQHAAISPEAGRWSVLQCMEHVTFVEGRFLGWLEQAKHLETPTVDKDKEARMAAMVTDRSFRAEAPEAARPTGRFTSVAQALDEFNDARTRTIRFTEERSGDLYSIEVVHPRFGPMNGAEFVRIIAGHAQRHAAQIREVRAAIGH